MKYLKIFESFGNYLDDEDFENIFDIFQDLKDEFDFERFEIYWTDEYYCQELGTECKNKYEGGISVMLKILVSSTNFEYQKTLIEETILRLKSEYLVYNNKLLDDSHLLVGISIDKL